MSSGIQIKSSGFNKTTVSIVSNFWDDVDNLDVAIVPITSFQLYMSKMIVYDPLDQLHPLIRVYNPIHTKLFYIIRLPQNKNWKKK